MQRVLITGGAGFIGSHLCDRFLADNWHVLCMDNLVTGSEDNIAHLRSDSRFAFAFHDVSNTIDVEGPVDAVLHFASPASPRDFPRIPIQILKVGSRGTHNALGLAKAKEARFVLASTSEVYGDPQVSPQSESYWGHVNPIGPRSVYDEAKRFAEAITMAYHRHHGVNTRIVRIFNTYGPRMAIDDGRVLPQFFSQLLTGNPVTIHGDGSQTRSFMYVDDLVEGVVQLLASECHDPVNIGNPDEVTISELAVELIELTASTSKLTYLPLPQDDPKRRCPDIARARSVLNWQPLISRHDGLLRTLPYFRDQVVAANR